MIHIFVTNVHNFIIKWKRKRVQIYLISAPFVIFSRSTKKKNLNRIQPMGWIHRRVAEFRVALRVQIGHFRSRSVLKMKSINRIFETRQPLMKFDIVNYRSNIKIVLANFFCYLHSITRLVYYYNIIGSPSQPSSDRGHEGTTRSVDLQTLHPSQRLWKFFSKWFSYFFRFRKIFRFKFTFWDLVI